MSTSDREELLHQREHELLATSEAEPLTDEPVAAGVLAVPRSGLGRQAASPRRVLVLGAGVAGLVAAYELKRRGHQPTLLEAQNRVGGRVYTMRSFAPGLYAEAGAMRIPRVHELTLAYCHHFGLQMRPFVTGNPKGLVYVGGRRYTQADIEADPSLLPFELSDTELGRTVAQLWEEATADIRELLRQRGSAAWTEIAVQYDQFSLREFLELRGFSEGAIEMYGVLNFVEAELNNAVVEELREDLGHHYDDMQEIVGGMDQLPYAFYRSLADDIRFGANVTAVEQDERSVTVHYKTEAGRFSETADFAVCTIPFSVLPTVEFLTPLSRDKQRGIRQLNYSAATKILFQVRDRIWETEDGIEGGATVCDLAIRRMNYPPPNPATRRGVLLASYTWGQDALRWDAMDEETRLEEALDDVSRIHPRIREVYEVGASHAWYDDPWARGAFALFAPGQQSLLQDAIVRPEGRIYFAGEHCSLHHAWIQGALDSGIEAAQAINSIPD